MKNVGRKVHGWEWPIVKWARKKPRSRFRQWVWAKADNLDWRIRVAPKIKKMRGL